MVSSDKKILFRLFVLVAIVALVNCYENNNNSDMLKLLKRGIILRCQGNPVSCYGKRSLMDEPASTILDSDMESYSQEKQEINYERYLERLIRNCKLGIEKSCSTMLKIMLMNNQN